VSGKAERQGGLAAEGVADEPSVQHGRPQRREAAHGMFHHTEQGGLQEFTPQGVRFLDGSDEPFETVILATGYRAAVGMLGSSVALDRCGFGARTKRVISVDRPDLYFVGHNYGPAGGLRNISRDARLAARLIAERLRDSGQTKTEKQPRPSER